MIIQFKEFLNEKLGRIEVVEVITDMVWEKYKNAPINKPFVMYDIEYEDFKIKKLTIDNKYIDSENRMTFLFKSKIDENKNYIVYLENNIKFKKLKIYLHHELIHAYEFFKYGGSVDRFTNRDLFHFNSIKFKTEDNDEKNEDLRIMNEFLDVMYSIDMSEIRAFYNESIMFIKENKQRFRKFKYILKNTDIYYRYNLIKNFDINEFRKCDKDNLKFLIKWYYDIRKEERNIYNPKGYKNKLEYYKDMFLDFLKIDKKNNINITDNEIESFIKKFKEEIEYKKAIYLKYIGRLRTLMEY